MQIKVTKSKDGLEILGLVTPQEAQEIMGYRSSSCVNDKVNDGSVRCVWVSRGHKSKRRMFVKNDCLKVAKKREVE